MAVTGSDILLKLSANHPTDDTSTAGGAISGTGTDGGTQLVHGNTNEWLTRLVAKETGTLDDANDIVEQYQQIYVENAHATDTANNVRVWIENLYTLPPTGGVAKFTPANSGDGDGTKKVRRYGVESSGTEITYEDVLLDDGANEVSGVKDFTRVMVDVILNASTGALATLAGNLTSKAGTDVLGTIPAGYSYGLGEEIAGLWGPNTTGTSLSVTNRTTEPAGASGNWTRPVDLASALVVRNDTADDALTGGSPGQHWAVWAHHKRQPGSPKLDDIDIVIHVEGD